MSSTVRGEKGEEMRLIDADSLHELIDGGFDLDFDEVPETKRELLRMVDEQPTIDAVPRKAFDGILWENDVMKKQLADIGKSFGEKMDDVFKVVLCKDCRWWNPHGKETPASIPALGECQFKDRNFGTACWEFCFWGERKDDEAD